MVRTRPQGHTGPISGVATSGNRYVATAGYDNRLVLWEHRDRRPIARGWHDHLINSSAFSSDGTLLVSASSDYSARLWSVPDLRLVTVLNGHRDDVEMAAFHPGGDLVATACRDHRARVFTQDGTLVLTLEGHEADVLSVQWGECGDQLVSSSDDGTVKRWSLASGELIENIDMGGVETDTIAVSTTGVIYAGDDAGVITVLANGRRSTVCAHDAGIKRLVIDQARGLLVSLSYDRTMALWDLTDFMPTLRVRSVLAADVWPRSCALLGQRELVLATFGARYRTYDIVSGRWTEDEVEPTGGVNAVADVGGDLLTVGDSGLVVRVDDPTPVADLGSLCNFLTPTASLVLTGGQLGRLFDALTGKLLHQHRSPLNCGVRFVREGVEHALVGTYTGEGLLFAVLPDGLRFLGELRLHKNAVKSLARSGPTLFSVAADASVTWVDIATLTPTRSIDHGHDKIANGCVGLGEDGMFASVGRDLKLRLWGADGSSVAVPTPHDHSVKCVAAGPDGRLIATASYSGCAAIYDRITGEWTEQIRLSMSGISSLCYSQTRGQFLAGCYDGAVYALPRSKPLLRGDVAPDLLKDDQEIR